MVTGVWTSGDATAGKTGVPARDVPASLVVIPGEILRGQDKGTGLGVARVLFLDVVAGALIATSMTGFLLWTRLHGSRLLAGGIALASLALALGAAVPALS